MNPELKIYIFISLTAAGILLVYFLQFALSSSPLDVDFFIIWVWVDVPPSFVSSFNHF